MAFDSLFQGMRASATALSAERVRVDVISSNIANAQTTSRESGPYLRRQVQFEPILHRLANGDEEPVGVRVSRVEIDRSTPTERIHDPSHPNADANGWVEMPNVNVTREMADLIAAMRAYDANLRAQEGFVQMAERALQLAR